jgi:oxygen-independent coproporphyrinogen-3 oxidase
MMNALRLKDGVPAGYFAARTGQDSASIATQINRLQRQGLMESGADRYSTTALGYQFLNTVLQSF